MLHLKNISFEFGGEYLFRTLDWFIKPKERIGLIGKNGAGKSTLLKLIIGQYELREGSIDKQGGVRLGYISQDMISQNEDKSVLETAKEAFERILFVQKELEHLYELIATDPSDENLNKIADYQEEFDAMDGYTMESRTAEILEGLGFKTSDLNRKMSEFSGGWRMRVVLAKMLLEQPDIMLLDEPTNHLDLPSIEWLENYLSNYPGSVVIVSHDREFLNKMINRTAELANQKLYLWDGNYDFYLNAKVERDDLLSRQAENQKIYIKDQEKFINRFKAKASKAKAVQSRIKMLDKLDVIEEIQEDKTNFTIDFKVGVQSGKVVMEMQEIEKRFGTQELFRGVNREINRGDKIALIGANGTGKTTYLKIIAQEEEFGGKVISGHNVIPSFYAQHQLESLHLDYEILDELKYDAPHKAEQELRTVLGCFLFSGEDVYKKIKVLSGGERARVSLAKTLVSEANFLLLDEPTNHLDIDSIEIIIEALQRYTGTLIFVSHNRYFIEKLANKIWWIEDQDVKEYPGTFQEYQYKLEKEKALKENQTAAQKIKEAENKSSSSKKDWKQRDEKQELIKKINKEIENIEEKQVRLNAEKVKLELSLVNDQNISAEDYKGVASKLSSIRTEIATIEAKSENLLLQLLELEE